jgi:hypothetical protein
MDREISGSFHTLIANTSSLPITKLSSCGFEPVEASGTGEVCGALEFAVAAAFLDPACAQSPVDRRSIIATETNPVLKKLTAILVMVAPVGSSSPMLMAPCVNLLFRSP